MFSHAGHKQQSNQKATNIKRRRKKQKIQKQSSVTASWNTDNKSDRAARLSYDINDSLRQQQQQQPGSVEEGDWTAGVLRPPHSRQQAQSNSGAFTSVCLFVFLVDTWSVPHYWISKYKHDCNRQLIIMHVFLSNRYSVCSVWETPVNIQG